MRKRLRRRRNNEGMSGIAIAFGAGLILALFGSVRLALIVAAVALIWIGCGSRSC